MFGTCKHDRALYAFFLEEHGEQALLISPIDKHDRLIAFVLGLSHAINITFSDVLVQSGEAARRLIQISSTTFDAQLLVSAAIARENPHLYFEIQKLNEFGSVALDTLCASVEKIRQFVRDDDEQGFVEIMENGHKYFALRRKPDEETNNGGRNRRRTVDG